MANVALAYFVRDHSDKIDKVEAQTINIDPSGKAVAIEVSKNQIFDVDVTNDWREKRFSFPSVEVGSVLEYRYRTVSQRYTFPDGWTFQNELPTLHSENTVEIRIQDMDYRLVMQGDRLLAKYGNVGKEPVSTWSLDNLPAFTDEPFVANKDDYAETVRFQLAGYKKMDNTYKAEVKYVTVMTTWEKLAEEVLSSTEYFPYLNRGGKARDILAQIVSATDAENAKIEKIYNYVRSNLNWNGKHRIFPEQNIGQLLEAKQGSSAEINLLLTLLLREADFDARPALVSTRSHGKAQQSYPMLTEFNHLLASVRLNGKDMLLNATDPLRPYNLLAEEDLNWAAFVLDKKESRWIKIEQAPAAKQSVFAEINLSDPAKPACQVSVRYENHDALNTRKKYLSLGEPKYLSQHKAALGDYQLVKFKQENLEKTEDGLVQQYELTLEDADKQAKTLYFQPVVWNPFTENPFKGTTRNLPVELIYPRSYQYVLKLKIPEGYQVQEMPKPLLLALPDNMGQFRYQVGQNGSELSLMTSLQIKTVFVPTVYYSHLRQFYDQIIGKYKEMVVLKK
jgi:hypothetical protein